MQNQFLSTPLLTSGRNKIQSKQAIVHKDELIKGLELKNQKLRSQIMKIQNTIDENLSVLEGPENNVKKQRKSIMRNQENSQALTKQLANAYKKIKMYEYQIDKVKDTSSQGEIDVIHKVKQLESILKEKKTICDKLKAKYSSQQKSVADITKKLNNNNYQNEIQKKIKLLTDEVKFLRQKVKDLQGKAEIKQTNMKKQLQFIRKVEQQLTETGMSVGEIDEIKLKINKKSQALNMSDSHIYRSTSLQKSKMKEEEIVNEQVIEDRTKDRFRQLQSEIKLLQKLQCDYEKKIQHAQTEKGQAMKLNSQSRDRLLQIQIDIEKVQKQILVIKGQVLPSNMKPLKPLRSVSSHQTAANKQKKTPAKNFSIHKTNKTLTHILKFDQVGMISEKGQRFTDRNILGKNKLNTKMTGLVVYLNPNEEVIGGIHAVYGNKKGGQYLKKDRQAKQPQYKEQRLECTENQWIKGMSGTLTDEDKLQSLYVITSKGQSKRFGESKNTKKSFTFDIGPDESPVCIFGALCIRKEIGKLENSVIEHFGIEINSQGQKKSKQGDFV